MFQMPMSSPMMTTMLGFFACCPVAGGEDSGSAACMDQAAPISAAVAASSDKPLWIDLRFMFRSFFFSRLDRGGRFLRKLGPRIV